MRTCFVTMPYGSKPLADGRPLDFNRVYLEMVLPAVQRAGLECRRPVDVETGVVWQKSLLSWLIASDLVIADLSTPNPNVLYELGLRHALRRGRTLLIAGGDAPLPGDLAALRLLRYRVNDAGGIDPEEAGLFAQRLAELLRQPEANPVTDSPVFGFFPDLQVQLPEELMDQPRPRAPTRRPTTKRAFTRQMLESPNTARGLLADDEAALRAADTPSAEDFLTLLRRYRDLSDWDRVITLADEAPPPLAGLREVRQQQALALNRRGQPGDAERAIVLMTALINEAGSAGDSESHGILGRIHKDRYDQALARGDGVAAAQHLVQALQCYRQGFDLNPADFYTGINVVNLLLQLGDAGAPGELARVLPRVRDAVRRKLDAERPDFWILATDLQLAAIAGDWPQAERDADQALALAPPGWMLETTLRDLRALATHLPEPARPPLQALIRRLQAGQPGAETEARDA